eukprot:g1371.t1
MQLWEEFTEKVQEFLRTQPHIQKDTIDMVQLQLHRGTLENVDITKCISHIELELEDFVACNINFTEWKQNLACYRYQRNNTNVDHEVSFSDSFDGTFGRSTASSFDNCEVGSVTSPNSLSQFTLGSPSPRGQQSGQNSKNTRSISITPAQRHNHSPPAVSRFAKHKMGRFRVIAEKEKTAKAKKVDMAMNPLSASEDCSTKGAKRDCVGVLDKVFQAISASEEAFSIAMIEQEKLRSAVASFTNLSEMEKKKVEEEFNGKKSNVPIEMETTTGGQSSKEQASPHPNKGKEIVNSKKGQGRERSKSWQAYKEKMKLSVDCGGSYIMSDDWIVRGKKLSLSPMKKSKDISDENENERSSSSIEEISKTATPPLKFEDSPNFVLYGDRKSVQRKLRNSSLRYSPSPPPYHSNHSNSSSVRNSNLSVEARYNTESPPPCAHSDSSPQILSLGIRGIHVTPRIGRAFRKQPGTSTVSSSGSNLNPLTTMAANNLKRFHGFDLGSSIPLSRSRSNTNETTDSTDTFNWYPDDNEDDEEDGEEERMHIGKEPTTNGDDMEDKNGCTSNSSSHEGDSSNENVVFIDDTSSISTYCVDGSTSDITLTTSSDHNDQTSEKSSNISGSNGTSGSDLGTTSINFDSENGRDGTETENDGTPSFQSLKGGWNSDKVGSDTNCATHEKQENSTKQQLSLRKGTMNDYSVVRMIGRGSFAQVWFAFQRKTKKGSGHPRPLVIKKMTRCAPDHKMVQNELLIMSRLKHPNIIQMLDYFVEHGVLHIVLEFADEGTLSSVLKRLLKRQKLLPEKLVWIWLIQLMFAVIYLHDQRILHRDIKPTNILLTGEGKRIVKLADFGLAKALEGPDTLAETMVGTPYYLSPELCEGNPYDERSDVWALGCVAFEMCALRKPFRARSIPALIRAITKTDPKPMSPAYSCDLREVVQKMMARNRKNRPMLRTLVKEPGIERRAFLLNQKRKRNTDGGELN